MYSFPDQTPQEQPVAKPETPLYIILANRER